jgi:signal peptidase I
MPFDSMEPAIATGAEVVAEPGYYASHHPRRWEVVLFSLPDGSGPFVKRIVGLPGETIQLTAHGVRVNGQMLAPPAHLKDCFSSVKHHANNKHGSAEFQIPAGSVFLVGDNTAIHVADSREHGAVPVGNLQARVVASINLM